MCHSLSLVFRFLLLPLFLLSLTLPGCKKEDPPAPPPTNSEKILGTWTETERLEDVNLDGQFVDVLQACELDDTWTFSADGQFHFSENGTTCEPVDPADFTIAWALQEEETVLYRDYIFTYDRTKIITLNDTLLVLHRPLDFNDLHGRVYSKMTLKR